MSDCRDGDFEDWFELHNAGPAPVSLGGFYLTDTMADISQFTIPAGTTIPAGGHLLVWADGETAQNGPTPGQLHAGFRLGAGGEQIALHTPDGTLVDLITFGAQSSNQSEGRYPDGTDSIVLPVPTPGKRNALTPEIIGVTDAGAGTSSFTFATEPSHTYQVESSTGLETWSPWGTSFTAAGTSSTISLPRTDARRYWRARLVVP